jgi:hypothetical protein
MKLKINESKILEFEMDTSGCSWKELEGYFRLTLDNVEYGFPAIVEEGMIRVDIPVFKDVLNEGVKSSLYKHKEVTVKARLDLIANNEAFLSPWRGEIDIEIPVSVKISEEKAIKSDKSDKKVKVIDPDIKEYLDEEKKKAKKSKLLDAFSKPLDDSMKVNREEDIDEKKEIKDKETRVVKKSKFSKVLS